jgi:hypothetical protein
MYGHQHKNSFYKLQPNLLLHVLQNEHEWLSHRLDTENTDKIVVCIKQYDTKWFYLICKYG